MNAASVLPEPVGAAISTLRPALMSGHASACAGVGALKCSSNQVVTEKWNKFLESMPNRENDAPAASGQPCNNERNG